MKARLVFATMLALTSEPKKPQNQTVRTSFVAGARQPAGTIHQYLAQVAKHSTRGGTK
jgi:hypothetical protein